LSVAIWRGDKNRLQRYIIIVVSAIAQTRLKGFSDKIESPADKIESLTDKIESPARRMRKSRETRTKARRGIGVMSRRIFFSIGECLILYQLQSLPPVERELVVVADEGNTIAQGVGDDDMVAGVVVLLRLVDFEAGIS